MTKHYLLSGFILLALSFTSCKDVRVKQKESYDSTQAIVVESGNTFTLTYGPLKAVIDATNGGKLSGLYWMGENFISDTSVHADNWGNSLWPSPQSAWGWPPSKQLDKLPYMVLTDTGYVYLKSQKDSLLGLVFFKKYSINTKDTSLVITYTILNASEEPRKVAPWEITRVAPGGLTYFPAGEFKWKGELSEHMFNIDSITWFDYKAKPIPSGVPKLFASGKEGWMAQVNKNKLLVKKFPDILVEQYAPGEAEVELYANPDGSYIEIEQQGAYTEIAPGSTITYEVVFYARKMPQGVSSWQKGDPKLVQLAQELVK